MHFKKYSQKNYYWQKQYILRNFQKQFFFLKLTCSSSIRCASANSKNTDTRSLTEISDTLPPFLPADFTKYETGYQVSSSYSLISPLLSCMVLTISYSEVSHFPVTTIQQTSSLVMTIMQRKI